VSGNTGTKVSTITTSVPVYNKLSEKNTPILNADSRSDGDECVAGRGTIPGEPSHRVTVASESAYAEGNPTQWDIPGSIAVSERDEPPYIWSNGKFISVPEYLGKVPVSYQQNSVRISAIVQPIFSGVKGSIFSTHGLIFGCNEKPSYESCGRVRARIVCSGDPEHPSYYKHERCNDPGCPVCYPKFSGRLADGVTERAMGYKSVFPMDKLYHLVFWPEFREGYKNLKEAFRDARKMLVSLGAVSAVVWYHPYRIKPDVKEQLRRYRRACGVSSRIGFWELAHDDVLELGCMDAYIEPGPHFHAIASGYLVNASTHALRGVGGYKKVRYLDTETDIRTVSYYLSTHCCREATKSTVRYYGKISYSKLSKGNPRVLVEDVVCEVCGKHLVEYACEDDGRIGDLVNAVVTRRIIQYEYWINTKERRKLKRQDGVSKRARDIWGPDGRPVQRSGDPFAGLVQIPDPIKLHGFAWGKL